MIYTHVLNRAPAAGRHEYHAAGDGGISCGVSLPNAGHGPEGVRKVAGTLASVWHGGNYPS